MAGEFLGLYQVSRDYMASVGQRCTACRFRYLLVGVELRGDRYTHSQFGDGFYVLFAGDDLEQVFHVMESYCYIDVRFAFDCMYEVWHVVDGEPDWLYQMALSEALRQLREAVSCPDYDGVWAKVDEISSESAEWNASHPDLARHLRSVCQSGSDALAELGDMAG